MNGVVKAERELTRSEIVRGLLGAPIEKSLLHSFSSLRFLADTVVPTYIGAWVRIWLVKRYDAPRATKPGASPTPTIGHSINHVSLDLGKLAASEHVFEDVSAGAVGEKDDCLARRILHRLVLLMQGLALTIFSQNSSGCIEYRYTIQSNHAQRTRHIRACSAKHRFLARSKNDPVDIGGIGRASRRDSALGGATF